MKLTKEQREKLVAFLKESQQINADVQGDFSHGSPYWHKLESVDDRLHECLTILGD